MGKGLVVAVILFIVISFAIIGVLLVPKDSRSVVVEPLVPSGTSSPSPNRASETTAQKNSGSTGDRFVQEKKVDKSTEEEDDVRTRSTPHPQERNRTVLAVRTDGGTQGVKATSAKTLLQEKGRFKVTNGTVAYDLAPLVNDPGAKDDEQKKQVLDLSPDIKEIYIEVGTNTSPEFGPMTKGNPNALLVAFEPQPPIYDIMVKTFVAPRKQLLAIPAAITPTQSLVQMQVSEVSGCSTLLDPNDSASAFAHRAGKKAGSKPAKTQFRTVEFCTKSSTQILVPSFPLHQVLNLIPGRTPVSILSTDAQGYDLAVVSTLGKENAKTIPIIVVECQDLEHGDKLMLVKQAPNCKELQKCIEGNFPHMLDFCYDNAPKVREVNCLYRNTLLPPLKLPTQFKITSLPKMLAFNATEEFKCPTFAP